MTTPTWRPRNTARASSTQSTTHGNSSTHRKRKRQQESVNVSSIRSFKVLLGLACVLLFGLVVHFQQRTFRATKKEFLLHNTPQANGRDKILLLNPLQSPAKDHHDEQTSARYSNEELKERVRPKVMAQWPNDKVDPVSKTTDASTRSPVITKPQTLLVTGADAVEEKQAKVLLDKASNSVFSSPEPKRDTALETPPPHPPKAAAASTFQRESSADSQAERREAAYLEETQQEHPELQYAPKRIPAYLYNSSRTLFGYVMRDLTTRICHRQLAQSNILVVSRDAPDVMQLLKERDPTKHSDDDELRRRVNYTVGGSTLIHCSSHHHSIHGIYDGHVGANEYDTVDRWWNEWGNKSHVPQPNSGYRLMMVDSLRSDDILRQAQIFLQQASVTYIVVSFGSDPHPHFRPFGIEAIQTLIRHHYKVQLLSVSHISDERIYRPNSDITEDGAAILGVDIDGLAKKRKQPVRGYVFATQGLDLAFPLATEYVEKVAFDKITYRKCDPTFAGVQFDSDSPSTVNVTCHNQSLAFPLPPTIYLNVSKTVDSLWHSHGNLEDSEAVCVRIKECKPKSMRQRKGKREFFPAPVSAGRVACASRILPKNETVSKATSPTAHGGTKPNLLLLMIDPISRARFQRSLPKTSYLVQMLNFTSLSAYTAVGNNSGPNLAALYSGRTWQSRDAIASMGDQNWLWDTLREQGGYATLKAGDGCIDNSNMIQSIRPQMHHGDAFNRMMCFEFQRPNCIGGKPAAQHLLEYATDFIGTYNRLQRPWAAFLHFIDSHEDSMMMEGMLDDFLCKFILGVRDGAAPLSNVWDNTVIMLLSNNGIRHGSYLMTKQGLKERVQPILFMRLPLKIATPSQREILDMNSIKYTTPFDVHATLVQLLLPDYVATESLLGLTLLRQLPDSRRGCNATSTIPETICSLFQATDDGRPKAHTERMMPSPMSALSFYADVPKLNRPSLDTKPYLPNPANATPLFLPGQACVCSTSHRNWHNCSWSGEYLSQGLSLEETFAIVDCGRDQGSKVDVEVKRNPSIVNRHAVKLAHENSFAQRRPSILFIEVDSVSQAYADRHLPKTREMLQRFRIQETTNTATGTTSYDCASSRWCSADLSEFSVFAGGNSIPNQVASFSGCMTTTGPKENCMHVASVNHGGTIRSICNDRTHIAYGMEKVNEFRASIIWCRIPSLEGDHNRSPRHDGKISPWIFDLANYSGYVTLFAEEFCYDNSPFVAQGNLFHLHADFLPHLLFCRITERKITRKGRKVIGPLWKTEGATDPLATGIDGENSFPKVDVALSYIRSMWDAYHDVPKFAYLNALAAHVYLKYPWMSLAAEAYDTTLASFLENMLEREDTNNTIFIVRSDHGHQGPPNNIDYSSQIEALRPWTEIIVPKNFPNYTIQNLYKNQHRLVSGPDLYRSLANLIVQGEPGIMPAPSDWTIDFLNDEIPMSRTCADAKVSSDYCVYEAERTLTSPNWGTCNLAENKQAFLCPSFSDEWRHSLSANVRSVVVSRRIEEESFCRTGNLGNVTIVSAALLQRWGEIDKTVAKFPASRVSGGIFLYPRQTALITSLVRLMANGKRKSGGERLVVCETGFGAGHGSATFLSASPYVDIHIFDKFDRPYQLPALGLLQKRFPEQNITHHPGDSCLTVPRTLLPVMRPAASGRNDVRCDVLHGSSLCKSDNIDLVEKSPCGILLTTTAMNSLTDNVVYFGPRGQWTELFKRGCIRDVVCYEEEKKKLERTYVFNQGGATISHKFCFAITTGICQKYEGQTGLQDTACETPVAKFTKRHLKLSQLCKANQVPLPAV